MARFYDKAVWRRARGLFLAEQPLCQRCREVGRVVPATDVDHITPISQGGAALDKANFRALCRSCHSYVTRHQLGETEKPMKGCDSSGMPTDPSHPWFEGE